MNRKLTICLLTIFMGISIFASAQDYELGSERLSMKPYTHSLGINVGSLNGISYKALVTDHFAISTDLGVKFNYIAANRANITAYTFEWDMDFMYQFYMSDHSFFFLGGGFVLGYNWKFKSQVIDGYVQGWNWYWGQWGYTYPVPVAIPYGRTYSIYHDAGKGGVHGILGFEFVLDDPVSISFDFRPGYSEFFGKTYDGRMAHVGGFDWSIDFAVRYTF